MTGDEISNGAQIAGGGLFGGPIGVFSTAVSVMFEEAPGGDVIDQVAPLFDGDRDDGGDGAPAVFAMSAGRLETHDRATGTVAPIPAPEAAPVVALAAATGEKVPEAPEAGVWLSSIPQVKSPATGITGGDKVVTISPATAQLLLEAIGYPPISPANPRAATQLYDHGQPVHIRPAPSLTVCCRTLQDLPVQLARTENGHYRQSRRRR